MTLRQRKILIKSVALVVCLIAMFYIALFDAWISMDYSAYGYNPASIGFSTTDNIYSYSPVYWFLFFTHISDVTATTWLLLSWIAVVFRFEKFEDRLNGQYIKMIPFSMILLTGFIFGVVAYIPTVYRYANLNSEWAELSEEGWFLDISQRLYGILEIFATTCKHIFIPGTFLALVFLDTDYPVGPSKQRKRERAITLFMILTVYTIWVILLLSYTDTVRPPYPFFDWSVNDTALWIPLIKNQGVTAMVNLLCFVFTGLVFEFIALFTMVYWEKVNKAKESTEEIVINLQELEKPKKETKAVAK